MPDESHLSVPKHKLGQIIRDANPTAPEEELRALIGIMMAAGEEAASSPPEDRRRLVVQKARLREVIRGAIREGARDGSKTGLGRTRHPRELVGAGKGLGAVVAASEAATRLDAITHPVPLAAWAGEVLRPTDVVARFGIARSTLDAWRRKGLAIALREGIERHVYPAAQFAEKAPLHGIKPVLTSASGNGRVAWRWLLTPNVACNGLPPLERLRCGAVDEVAIAAERDLG
jgi:hypothetical protein